MASLNTVDEPEVLSRLSKQTFRLALGLLYVLLGSSALLFG